MDVKKNSINWYVCPVCHNDLYEKGDKTLCCTNARCHHSVVTNGFSINNGTPNFLHDHPYNLFDLNSMPEVVVHRGDQSFRRNLRSLVGENKVTLKNAQMFVSKILSESNPNRSKILIIGSGEIGVGVSEFIHHHGLSVVGIDVYHSYSVNAIADVHRLPFKSDFFDGVWIQAVLEHVLEPSIAVSEVWRVLKNQGVVYAETPFLQPVHEGAYDFTRYTVLGHRWLFRDFNSISVGATRGVNHVAALSLKYLFWGIFRNRTIASVFGVFFRIVFRPLTFILKKTSLFDSCTGSFFMGIKDDGYRLQPKDLLKYYNGMM